MTKTAFKEHWHMLVLVIGFMCLIGGALYHLLVDQYSYVYDVCYSIWVVCYGISLIVGRRRHFDRMLELERAQWDLVNTYLKSERATIEFFVPTKSNHTTVNLWRKMRGVQKVLLYKAKMDDNTPFTFHHGVMESNVYFLVNKKELFQMKLKGFHLQSDEKTITKALEESWLKEKMKV